MTMTHTLRLLPLLLAATVFAGCASLTRSDYATPVTDTPAAWSHTTTAGSTAPAQWWSVFNDSQLNALIDEALTKNTDLAAAAIKLRRAQLNAGLAEDALLPAASASLGNTQSRTLKNGGTITRSNSARAALSWEADLWGHLGHARDAAEWEAQASAQDREATALSLTGSTATLYWKLAWLNQRITLSAQNIAYAERTLLLAQNKLAAGAVSKLDVLQAEQDLASQRASATQLEQQREEARTAFALLFDGVPERRFEEPQSLPAGAMPEVAAGLPAALLGNRPDLAATELRLRSTLATQDATRTSYYPSLSLTGSLGSSSNTLRQVLNNPVAALATELALPFLQYNEMKLKNGIARADYDLAVVQFRQTLYTALGDVENALSARRQYVLQGEQLEKSFVAAQAAEKINEIRYRAGSIPLQTWLDSQQSRRSAEAALADNRYNQFASHATLSLALGGSIN